MWHFFSSGVNMTTSDDDWQWVVQPDEDSTSKYSGNDLSDAIAIGRKVNELRLKAGLSEQDVDDFAGIKKSDLLAIEAGLLVMDADMLAQLAMVLGVKEEELHPNNLSTDT